MHQSPSASTAQWTSRFLDAGGLRTHYLEAGRSDAPPLVLIHGGGAGADSIGNWRLTIPQLVDEFHIYAMDMVGFGRSAKPADFEYSQPARNCHLRDFLDALGLQRTALVGNSMGGATALGVAMMEPHRVDRLVLMGSAGLNSAITESLKPIVFYDYTMEGMHKLVRALTGARFQVSDEIVRLRYELSIEPDTRSAYSATMDWIRRQGGLFYTDEAIAAVKVPTLVVNGKDDLVVPLKNAYRFLELLQNSWGYLIPHCGHWAMVEAPAEFVAATRSFLHAEIRL